MQLVEQTAKALLALQPQSSLTPSHWDTLAIIYTAVKILFVGGATDAAAALVAAADCLCPTGVAPHIGNESAYFGMIKSLLLGWPMPTKVVRAGVRPIYMCGDSHCLPGGCKSKDSQRDLF